VKRALALVAMLAGVAQADNAPLVTPPAGWKQDSAQATALAAKANEVSHFGGLRSLASSDVYVAPEGGAALIITAVAGKVTPADRDVAARFAIDEVHEATSRAALGSNAITEDSWATKAVVEQKLVRGDLQWTDKSVGMQTYAVIQIVADDENIVSVTGECEIANAKLAGACLAALTTLDPGIPLAKRQPIGLAAPGTPLSAPPVASPAQRPPSTLSDGSHTPMPPMTVPTKEKPATDRRPVYVGLGIVLLAAAFWWNQRRRARFEKDSDE